MHCCNYLKIEDALLSTKVLRHTRISALEFKLHHAFNMSYYNLLLHLPLKVTVYLISLSIAKSYFRQHTVIVDLLLHKKI